MSFDSNYTNFSFLFSFDYNAESSLGIGTGGEEDINVTSAPKNVTTISTEYNVSEVWTTNLPTELGEKPQFIYDWGDSIYPSGFSQVRIILTSFFVTCIMVIIVVGNMLVCIAIATEKALKTVQNWFIASLAVSDFLVGLVIMPFSLAGELMGYWIFGPLWCDIHSALDVLLCTASINNLCLISLDRYWSVTQAVEYLKKRTPSRAIAMICIVWVLSALISLPPLLGWKKDEQSGDLPQCQLNNNTGYVVYSALGSFYVPAFVMVFVYIRIFRAARSRARRHVKKARHAPEVTNDPPRDKSTTTTTCTSFSNPSPPDKHRDMDIFTSLESRNVNGCHTKRDSPSTPVSAPQIIIESSNESPPQCSEMQCSPPQSPPPLSEMISAQNRQIQEVKGRMDSGNESGTSDVNTDSEDTLLSRSVRAGVCLVIPEQTQRTSLLCAPKVIRSAAFGSSMSLANLDKAPQNVNELYEARNPAKKRRKRKGRPLRQHQHYSARPLPSDTEKQKRRLAKARERRATLILGLIMAAFILAWLPFFVLYVVQAFCARCKINDTGFSIAFWLGYCNSALNPIIYTIFNRDFRRAFKKILFK